ncbi:hypothetical protein FACS1894206_02040 [Deltaproteobacteria bacterium]|nr:hypothetical protein FACS1894206_02040 [Deltaproteobacteria bacterium]
MRAGRIRLAFPTFALLFCHYERAVNEASGKVYGPVFLKVAGECFKNFSEYARFDPLGESTVTS